MCFVPWQKQPAHSSGEHILWQIESEILIISTCLARAMCSFGTNNTWRKNRETGEPVNGNKSGQECVYSMCLTYYAWIRDKCALIWSVIRHGVMCLHFVLRQDDSEFVCVWNKNTLCLFFATWAKDDGRKEEWVMIF